jgi:hypothetical protein
MKDKSAIAYGYNTLALAVFESAVSDAKGKCKVTKADQADAIEWLHTCGLEWLALCNIGVKPSEYSAFLATLPKPEPITAGEQFALMVKTYINQYIQSLQPVA